MEGRVLAKTRQESLGTIEARGCELKVAQSACFACASAAWGCVEGGLNPSWSTGVSELESKGLVLVCWDVREFGDNAVISRSPAVLANRNTVGATNLSSQQPH